MSRLNSINPATGELLQAYDEMSPEELDGIVKLSREGFLQWRAWNLDDRGEALKNAGRLLRSRKDEYARLMALEMGKPFSQGQGEVAKCAWVCDHYAEYAEEYLEPEPAETDAIRSYVAFVPLGPILAIMPWNFPFWQVFRFAAPSLMAGNTVVLKHASNVTGCALAIEALLHEAGVPEPAFRAVRLGSAGIGSLIEHRDIMAVTLTGSTSAGRAVAAAAGRALKKTVLELGGSDPYVVLEDADLTHAARACADARMINGGQSCIAGKRFIVVESVRDRFEQEFMDQMGLYAPGDPLDPATKLGPLARADLRDELQRQVSQSLATGARLLMGGSIPEGPGAFYPPTVLSQVCPGMPACDEELFGPVAAILSARDEEQAIELANQSDYGLGAAVFTRDRDRGEVIAAERLEAGCCFVNDIVRSDPRLPFGGTKDSGYGRELGVFGIREFVNIKTVYVK